MFINSFFEKNLETMLKNYFITDISKQLFKLTKKAENKSEKGWQRQRIAKHSKCLSRIGTEEWQYPTLSESS